MKEEFTFYVGVDWGVEFHQACILNAHGEKICQRRIEHSGPGMLEFCDFLQALSNGEACSSAVSGGAPRGYCAILRQYARHVAYLLISLEPPGWCAIRSTLPWRRTMARPVLRKPSQELGRTCLPRRTWAPSGDPR
jgi:hypothetical protein